jgi:colanic acid/amylovoran biosynthesis glycosyltransferase
MSAAQRHVTHVVHDFVTPSAGWLYDLITSHERYTPRVLCAERINAEEFPFANVQALLASDPSTTPPSHRLRSAVRRLGWQRRERNPWHAPLRDESADILHAHFGMAGWRCAEASTRPVVTSFYGYDVGLLSFLRWWAPEYAFLFAHGSLFLAEGPSMAGRLVELGAPPAKVQVQPLVADLSMLTWRAPSAGREITIVMAGRFVEKKGFLIGLQAFAQLAKHDLRLRLRIVGSGPQEDVLRQFAAREQLADRVEFAGFAGREVYRSLLNSADIFLQPSHTASDGDTEGGAPTTLFDAQGIGLVIVGSDHADIPFVTAPGAAYIAREGDVDDTTRALTQALDTIDEWPARSAAGLEHVSLQHGRTVAAQHLEVLYDQVLHDPRQ